MKVFAHRGFSGKYPENTMIAFDKAIEVGSDGIELDVHLSKDGKLVIMHDEKLQRTTGKPGTVSDYSLEELTKIQACLTHPEFKDAKIPSFEEYCSYVSRKDIITNVEIKTNSVYYDEIEEKLLEAIKRFGLEDRVIISSFNWLSVVKFKLLAPHIPCGLLWEGKAVPNISSLIKDMKIEFYHPNVKYFDQEDASSFSNNEIRINCWTVNSEEEMKKLISWGAAGAIGNFPDMCLKVLGRL